MQITPVNIPTPPQSANPQQTVSNGLQHVQVEATTPVTQNAVAASQRDEGSNKAKERRKEGRHPSHEQSVQLQHDDDETPDRGENLNLSI